MQAQPGVVYLLHFDRPISPNHTCQHYIGWCWHLGSRIDQHLKGRGARLTQVAHERGIAFEIAATWPGSKSFERKLKNRKDARSLCPICRAARRHPAGQLTLDLEDDYL